VCPPEESAARHPPHQEGPSANQLHESTQNSANAAFNCRNLTDRAVLDILVRNTRQPQRHFTNASLLSPRSAAFHKWHHSFGPEYRPYLRRAIAMWSSIRQWAGAHLPALLDSLRPGASEQELQDVHVHLGMELPPAVKVRGRRGRHCGGASAAAAGKQQAAAAQQGMSGACTAAGSWDLRMRAHRRRPPPPLHVHMPCCPPPAPQASCSTSSPPRTTHATDPQQHTPYASPHIHPAPPQVIYRLHDGQQLAYDEEIARRGQAPPQPSTFLGLLGGYSFYDRVVSCRLMPLARCVRYSERLRRVGALDEGQMLLGGSFRWVSGVGWGGRLGLVAWSRAVQVSCRAVFCSWQVVQDWAEELLICRPHMLHACFTRSSPAAACWHPMHLRNNTPS
jgi:hypothetical protein